MFQTTCVYDTTAGSKGCAENARACDGNTPFGLETIDEMCINTVMTLHKNQDIIDDLAAIFAAGGVITSDGNMCTGELAEGERGHDVAALHPEAAAQIKAQIAALQAHLGEEGPAAAAGGMALKYYR